MTLVEHEYVLVVFQQPHAVCGVHGSSICDSFQVDGGHPGQRHHASCIVLVIIAERLSQHSAGCLINVAQRATPMRDLNEPRTDFLMKKLVNIQKGKLKDPFNFIRDREETLQRYLCSGIHFRGKGSRKKENVLENGKCHRESEKASKDGEREP